MYVTQNISRLIFVRKGHQRKILTMKILRSTVVSNVPECIIKVPVMLAYMHLIAMCLGFIFLYSHRKGTGDVI